MSSFLFPTRGFDVAPQPFYKREERTQIAGLTSITDAKGFGWKQVHFIQSNQSWASSESDFVSVTASMNDAIAV